MTPTPARPYHHGDLRRAIADTAMNMLSEDDGLNFTLREVARRAGVSHAAPYKHFPDKAALIVELALIGFDRLRKVLADGVQSVSTGTKARLGAAADVYLRFGEANPTLYRLMFSADAGTAADIHLNKRALAAFALLIDLLEDGQARGDFRRSDLRGQAATCWSLLHGMTLLQIDGLLLPEKVGSHVLETALATLLHGLASSPED